MKKLSRSFWILTVLLFAGIAVPTQGKAKKPKTIVQVTPVEKSGLYKPGKKATFTIKVTHDGNLLKEGTVKVKLTADMRGKIKTESFDLSKKNPFTISGTMNRPGFIYCRAILKKGVWGDAGAGFNPTAIKISTKLPADFDKFWNDGRKRLSKIPLDVKLLKLPKYCNAKQDSYKISFANINNTRIYGFLSIPKNRKGPFPAIFLVPGAGPGYFNPGLRSWAAKGALALCMNVHKYDPPNSRDGIRKIYKELNTPKVYMHHGSPDREKIYFRRAILGIDRALNYLASRPDFDKKHLAVYGSSQGGAFTLIMTGLNPKKVTAAAANVPALCNHMAFLDKRQPGWPKYFYSVKGRKQQDALLPYFDAANFARKITCPTIVSVGFADTTCAPNSVYAAYNLIKAPKRMFNEPTMRHSQSRRYSKFLSKWLSGQLELTKAIPPVK
jgi:cephalosporin-C deacetylase